MKLDSPSRPGPSRAAVTLTAGMVLLAGMTFFANSLSAERSDDESTAKNVSEMLVQHHLSHKRIDDNVSAHLLTRFLEDLDPQKMYFIKADVDGLSKYKHQLDDLVKVGDIKFAYDTFDLYLKRLDERLALAHKLIDQDHDFTRNEDIILDADTLEWAADDDEIRDRWRKRIKYDLLNLKLAEESTSDETSDDKTSKDEPVAEPKERLHKRYKSIGRTMHQTERMEIREMYLSALTRVYDPHSSYMSPRTLEDFQISMRQRLQGIGAALRSEDGFTIVASIVPGGAAAEDKRLKVGDKIIGVGQEEGDFVDVVEMKLSKVVSYIRGKKGTVVRLQVKTGKTGEVKVYDLTRKVIELKESRVRGEILKAKERLDGATGRVGVINIPSFYRDFDAASRGAENFTSTARDVRQVLADFQNAGGVDVVVIDLRTNGGGALSEAIEVSGLFIDRGPTVQVKQQSGRTKVHNDPDSGAVYDGPLVVVCNRLSASASEIFAGVIKDYRRGIIVGDTTTHGKGTVQNVMMVGGSRLPFLQGPNHGALKVTINQFYRVNGDSTQNHGVRSDVVLPSVIDHMEIGESFLDNALDFDKIEPADYKPVDMSPPTVIARVREASEKRVASDKDWKEIREDVERFKKRQNRKTSSLNEAVLSKERAEDKKSSDKDEEKDEEKNENGEGPIFPETTYNDELLHITVDYANLLKGINTARTR